MISYSFVMTKVFMIRTFNNNIHIIEAESEKDPILANDESGVSDRLLDVEPVLGISAAEIANM